MTADTGFGFLDLLRWCGRLLAVAVFYGVIAVVEFVVLFLAAWWVDTTVVQPAVGGSLFASLALYGTTLLVYVWLFSRLGASDTVSVPEHWHPWQKDSWETDGIGGLGGGGDGGGGGN